MKNSVLLFGGSSDERLVSVASAQNLATQFDFAELWFVFKNNQIAKIEKQELLEHSNPFKNELVPRNTPFVQSLEEAIPTLKDKVVFMGFHGTQGEDGAIQALFEKNKIAFTGTGSQASYLCFEKTEAKKVLRSLNLNLAEEIILDTKSNSNIDATVTDFFKKHKKIVIKPIANGSSIGLHIVSTDQDLQKALQDIRQSSHPHFMAEKFISGRELTIGVIEKNNQLLALPPSEVIVTAGSSFDYDGKYLGKNTKEITPADLTANQIQQAQQLALSAHKHLKCYGYSRTDAILADDKIYFLETNTLPGVTKASFIPQQLSAAGISMKDFIENQMKLALQRYDH